MLDSALVNYWGFIALLFALSVAVGKVAGPIFVRILEKAASRTRSTLDDRIISSIKGPIESFFFLVVFYFLLHYFPQLSEAAAFLERYTYAILLVITTYLLSEASGAVIRWYYEEGHKTSHLKFDLSLLPFVRKVTKLLIYLIGLTAALSATGFDVTGLIAVTSIAGLIIGLASQETLANIFAGIALQLDRPYRYGDYIRLPPPSNDVAIVRKIGMRSTRLEDMFHNTIIISNSEFAKMRVTNFSLPDDVLILPVQAEVPTGCDLQRLHKKIAAAFAKEKPEGLLSDRKHTITVDAVRGGTMTITVSIWARGYQNTPRIRHIANLAIADFLSGRK
ncbi:MAG: mechanosensitive ion channel family protein [Candidatus Micrarchaeota archaeon]|nr:mechanosensitive ion channel family protein [Candidatus Micrarchaeota archaeon]